MIKYIIILLDDTSTSFCHYDNSRTVKRLMPIETLQAGILYAIKENLSIQFVYPPYEIPQEYQLAIEAVEHTDIMPASLNIDSDVIVFDSILLATNYHWSKTTSYVLRTSMPVFFQHIDDICSILDNVDRLNIVFTDTTSFSENTTKKYSVALQTLSKKIEKIYVSGNAVQLNLLTDRMMLKEMNNCGVGDSSITLAPNGKFYICPAFYQEDNIGNSDSSVGDLHTGLHIKNPQLYKLNHAPLCRHCDAYQCKRCIWLNKKTTLEVNTPSHEQCVMAHLERNASRELLNSIREHGTFLPDYEAIKEINYLDPFEVRKDYE